MLKPEYSMKKGCKFDYDLQYLSGSSETLCVQLAKVKPNTNASGLK